MYGIQMDRAPPGCLFISKIDLKTQQQQQQMNTPIDPWNHIFSTLEYDGSNDTIITAAQIKECNKSWLGKADQFEPRLLCYQTSANQRPQIFKDHGLNILPIKNGVYLITKSNTYMPLTYIEDSKPKVIHKDTTAIMLSIGNSETSLIDNMRYSGIFDEILGEKITHGPLLNGRHRITATMKLGSKDISISGVQYETDACFESKNKILIIEGKSASKTIDSFNMRQLYFPFREATRLAAGKKEVVALFIHELKGVIHVWKYTFSDYQKMDSMVLTDYKTYTFSSQ